MTENKSWRFEKDSDLEDDMLQGVHLLVQFLDLLLFRWLVHLHILVYIAMVLRTVPF